MDKLPLDAIFCRDSVEFMDSLPSESVDLIFADPPYNMQLNDTLTRPNQSRVEGVSSHDWDRFENFQAYDEFSKRWLISARRLMKTSSSLWVIGTYHNIYRLGAILQDLGFWILNDIVWIKTNPMPNFRGTRFTNAHETLLWCARDSESSPIFNYHSLKNLNDAKQMRSDWYLPICSGGQRLRGEDGKSLHPTQKPESLLYRIIAGSSRQGQIVFDPFLGTGTSAVVAKRLGRHFIGCDNHASYIEHARVRIESTEVLPREVTLSIPQPREAPRIAFGLLLESGWLRPGDVLVSPDNQTAHIDVNGMVSSGGRRGSIHALGAALSGSSACNGWTFWRVKTRRGSIPLDELRQRLKHTLSLPRSGLSTLDEEYSSK